MNRPIWLNNKQIADLLDCESAYDAIVNALICHATGKYDQPLKPYVRPLGRKMEYRGGRYISMPAFLGGDFQMAGIKFIAGFPANVEIGLPRASGTIQLNSTQNGKTLAIMECEVISALRTAAIAMIGITYLAPSKPLRVAVIGAGPIGQSVIKALTSIHYDRVVEIRVCDTNSERIRDLKDSLRCSNLMEFRYFEKAELAVCDAEVVITATTGTKEYLEKSWLASGWLIIALSLDDATPELFLSADKVIVDDIEQSCREEKLLHRMVSSGSYRKEDIAAELGQIVFGIHPGRTNSIENIYLNPMGMAIEDIALATTVYQKAIELDAGQKLI